MLRALSGLLLLFLPVLTNAASDDPRNTPHPPLRRGPRRLVDTSGDCLQFGCDPEPVARSVTKDNVATLVQDWSIDLPEMSDGSPLYVSGVLAQGRVRNLIVLTTIAGRAMAVDARTGEGIWARAAPLGPRWTTSSPAVDPDRKFVYSYALDGYVHKYALNSGLEVTDGWPQLITLKPDVEKCSSPLTIATAANGKTYLYAAIAAYPVPGDDGDYQGHVVAIDLDGNSQVVFNALCSDQARHFALGDCKDLQAGIWARGGAVYDADTDRVFITTGNGTYDADQGGFNWGTSVVALRPDLTTDQGTPIDSYTPVNYQQLTDDDLDLSSTTIAILPRSDDSQPHLGVQSGKDTLIRLLDLDDLSGQGGSRHVGGEIEIVGVPQAGQVHTQPVTWLAPDNTAWVFFGTGAGVSALKLDLTGEKPHLVTQWVIPGGASSPIIANDVLYVAHSNTLRALDPETGNTLWSSTEIGDVHWQTPIVGGSHLYICDNQGHLKSFAVPATPR
ncbi:MAG TPA: PQQ-binding-like beta-propeller repeat protein [Thermoanaerobaculia bacterium]|nr:PQQ-binding-like beta-propeller repeat protein [Thermoanaerobaculia bacterium]